jgi:hypothetical protein
MTDKCNLDFCISFHAQLSVYHLGQWNYIGNILRHRRTKCFCSQRSISKEKFRGITFRPVMIILGDCIYYRSAECAHLFRSVLSLTIRCRISVTWVLGVWYLWYECWVNAISDPECWLYSNFVQTTRRMLSLTQVQALFHLWPSLLGAIDLWPE